jgi:hypothetical protein
MARADLDRPLTTSQAAELLGMSREGVARLVDRGELPGFRVGRHRRIHRADLEAFTRARGGDGTPITLDDIRAHRSEILAAAERHGVTDLRVFGSVANGTATPDSDIDVMVTPIRPIGLFDLAGLGLDLEAILGRPVDVLTHQMVETEVHLADVLVDAVPV